ncbi:exportin-5 [Trichonephila inaurata madagascariensis]|uniref:Exportin-5 n=1 Tax=Trichonephila inaurata madagascariensis TaxID=2747483 RepID=A0A8X6KGK9_9ARAC|nr:exportin-5 [Trichonephila inaurata madagascariensis]
MDAELERLNSEIVTIVNIILNPTTSSNDRKVAHEFFEGFKETSPYCAKCGFSLIARSNPPAVRHCAYQLIEHYIKLHWNNINDDEKVWIKNSIMETLASGIGPVNEEELHIKDAACKIVVEIIKREWPQQWTSLMEELDRLCRLGDTQVELVLLIFSQKYLIKKKFNIKGTETMINYRLSKVTLDTLCAFVDWVHIDHIKSGPLIPTLCRLLGCPDIRLDAIKCLRDVVDRKVFSFIQ